MHPEYDPKDVNGILASESAAKQKMIFQSSQATQIQNSKSDRVTKVKLFQSISI
jgi:hypothetical protein